MATFHRPSKSINLMVIWRSKPSFELLVRESLVTISEHQDEAQGDKNTTVALILKAKQINVRYCAISVYKSNSKTRPYLNFFYLSSKKKLRKKWSTFCRRADKEFQPTATKTYVLSISQGHPTRNFDEISVRESLLVLRLSDNALTKTDWFLN